MTGTERKKTVFIDNVCGECGISFRNASLLLKHLAKAHYINVNPRPRYETRPFSNEYNFVEVPWIPYDFRLLTCPSCWFYCDSQRTQALRDHIQDVHLKLLPKNFMANEDEVVGISKGRDFLAEKAILQKLSEITNGLNKLFGSK